MGFGFEIPLCGIGGRESADHGRVAPQSLVFSATGLPTGASFNQTTREFVWTPAEDQEPGSVVVTCSVTGGVVFTSKEEEERKRGQQSFFDRHSLLVTEA